jgi:hypothetical protein
MHTSQVARVTARPAQGSSVQRELQTVATFDMATSILVCAAWLRRDHRMLRASSRQQAAKCQCLAQRRGCQ